MYIDYFFCPANLFPCNEIKSEIVLNFESKTWFLKHFIFWKKKISILLICKLSKKYIKIEISFIISTQYCIGASTSTSILVLNAQSEIQILNTDSKEHASKRHLNLIEIKKSLDGFQQMFHQFIFRVTLCTIK